MPTIDTERIRAIGEMRRSATETLRLARLMEKPALDDTALMQPVHERLRAHYAALDRRTATRAEMLVLLWLFAPAMLEGGRRSGLMLEIARTMGLTANNAYAYRGNLLISYERYADFRKAVDDGIAVAMKAAEEKTETLH